jgi:alkylated DNA repair dioxygenase AlkB
MPELRRAEPSAVLAGAYRLPRCDDVLYVPGFIADADEIHTQLLTQIDWREESILMFGKRVRVPRLCAWCGDAGVVYRYSHTTHRAEGWPGPVDSLRDRLRARLAIEFNFALANLYRDGNDAMGWHADDERELGDAPCIASLSFGAPRRFDLRARSGASRRVSLVLEPGSLLLMWGDSQRLWQHALPRTKHPVGQRVNLTFRRVETSA